MDVVDPMVSADVDRASSMIGELVRESVLRGGVGVVIVSSQHF